jgi:RNA polymerase sigma factor (sigma-70 family)
MAHLTDQDILFGCISGNRQAQEAFVCQFSDLVYRTLQYVFKTRNIPCSQLDLEDLHNTVFLKLLDKGCKKLRQYKGKNGCSLSSWIRLITVRTAFDDFRKSRTDALARGEKVQSLDTMFTLAGETTQPWALMEKAEQSRLIQEGIQALLPRDRLFLKLHCMEGLSIKEVASILKISEANAHSVKHRAIERLKTKIAQNSQGVTQ